MPCLYDRDDDYRHDTTTQIDAGFYFPNIVFGRIVKTRHALSLRRAATSDHYHDNRYKDFFHH